MMLPEEVHVHASMNVNVKIDRRAKRKVWTAEDDEALRYWHGWKYTDGRIARKLRCCRRTVLRQRGAMNLPPIFPKASSGKRVRHGRD